MLELNVCIPARDRLITTKKTVESLRINTLRFDTVNIYIFDNLSNTTSERFETFSSLLKNKDIQYYSYDTDVTTLGCFPKMVIHHKFHELMELKQKISPPTESTDVFYMLCDNDIIFNRDWDSYFISAAKAVGYREPELRYLVPEPGGVATGFRKGSGLFDILNEFNKKPYRALAASYGGGSGLWFSDSIQFQKTKPEISDILQTKGYFKKHDSTLWTKFKRKAEGKHYVATITPHPSDYPLALHLGGIVGSMCNSLIKNSYYDNKFLEQEKEIENMTISDIISKYPDLAKW